MLEEGGGFITLPGELVATVADEEARMAECAGATGIYLVARVREDAQTPGPSMRVAGMVVARVGTLSRMRHAAKLEVMVDPAHRRRGIGRALLQACGDWAESTASIEKLSLNVFADNEAALGMYRALGFQEEGRRVREYKDPDGRYRDDVLMYRWTGGGTPLPRP